MSSPCLELYSSDFREKHRTSLQRGSIPGPLEPQLDLLATATCMSKCVLSNQIKSKLLKQKDQDGH